MDKERKMIAVRLKWARVNADLSIEEMAAAADVSSEVYTRLETGAEDFGFTFLFKCAQKLNMDISELVSGDNPKLGFYNITRRGKGMPIKREEGFDYFHLAPLLKGRVSEPFLVTAKYDPEAADRPVPTSTHDGQELDVILKGSMKVQLEDHVEILHEGDSVYYYSGHPHGMIAIDGEDCTFLAIVFKESAEEAKADDDDDKFDNIFNDYLQESKYENLIYKKYVDESIGSDGTLQSIKLLPTDNFNFGYDVVDALAEKCPDKRALLWLSKNKEEKDFTFSDISRLSNKTANYFRSLGIKQGDKVMLVLKRHYQFWLSIIALHKLGAIAIPATHLLTEKDFTYRFRVAGVNAIVCTSDGNCADDVDAAQIENPTLRIKSLVGGCREGWNDFDAGIAAQSDLLQRVSTHKDDPMVMFFSSGTTGYPKLAVHSYTYALGHIVTARWWHNVNPDGLHLTIADTGWGKALWGKLYGQWLCEAGIFAYDFDKFAASDILPLFAKYNITTFCAPPTMYRFFIKEDLSKYDLSSIKHATIAGEALNPEIFNKFHELTGLRLMEGYGQTETTLTVGNLCGMVAKPGSMGKPNPQYNVMIMDENGGRAAVGVTGEIVIGCNRKETCGMFIGYYGDEEITSRAWHNGFYHTGDMAYRDEDGYYWYVGRNDDIIKSSGYRIGPFEVESVIMELPFVLECAVTGVPHETRGQVVRASIVLTAGTQPSEALVKEVQEYVKSHTAPYKYPRVVEFVTSLPKTISGKIIRSEIK